MMCTSLLCASLLRREAGMSGTGGANVGDVGTSGGLRVCNGTFNIQKAFGVDPKYVEPRSVCLLVAVVA